MATTSSLSLSCPVFQRTAWFALMDSAGRLRFQPQHKAQEGPGTQAAALPPALQSSQPWCPTVVTAHGTNPHPRSRESHRGPGSRARPWPMLAGWGPTPCTKPSLLGRRMLAIARQALWDLPCRHNGQLVPPAARSSPPYLGAKKEVSKGEPRVTKQAQCHWQGPSKSPSAQSNCKWQSCSPKMTVPNLGAVIIT